MTDIIKLIKSRITFTIQGPFVEKILNNLGEAEYIRRIDADIAETDQSL